MAIAQQGPSPLQDPGPGHALQPLPALDPRKLVSRPRHGLETDASWGLLMVPIGVCLALLVFASLFVP